MQMSPNEKHNLLIISNHAAARARLLQPHVVKRLRDAKILFDVFETDKRGDAETETRRALVEATHNVIAAIGGDGTLSEVANGFFQLHTQKHTNALADTISLTEDAKLSIDAPQLINPRAALALLPAGTGDDFARGLCDGRRAPLDSWIDKLIRHLRVDERGDSSKTHAQTIRLVDVLDARTTRDASIDNIHADSTNTHDTNSHGTNAHSTNRFICLNAATLGIGAQVAARVAAQSDFLRRSVNGELRFTLAALQAIARWREQRLRISIDDDEPFELASNLIAITNGAYAGGGMRFSPDAKTDDGLLDVVTAHGLTRRALLREMMRIHKGGHVNNPRVRIQRAARVRIETVDAEAHLPIEADGDVRGHTPVEFRVLPSALRVVC